MTPVAVKVLAVSMRGTSGLGCNAACQEVVSRADAPTDAALCSCLRLSVQPTSEAQHRQLEDFRREVSMLRALKDPHIGQQGG